MDSTIRGQTVAIRNTNDAVSFSQTADGALGQINNTLQRLRELAVQSANGTNSAGDRQLLNTEFNQLQQEVTRIQHNTQFNGTDALQTNSVTVQIGAGTTQYDKISVHGIDLSKVTSATKTDAVATNAFTRAQFDAAKTALALTDPTRAANLSYNESNGHVYEKVATGRDFATAVSAANAASFGGQKGYLATITSADENAYMTSKAGNVSTWINASKTDATTGSGAFTGAIVSGSAALNNANVFSYNNASGGATPESGKLTYSNFTSNTLVGGSGAQGASIISNGVWSDTSLSLSQASFIEYGGNATIKATGAESLNTAIVTLGTDSSTLGQYQVNDASTISVDEIALNSTAGHTLLDSNNQAITTALTAGMQFYVQTTGSGSTGSFADSSSFAILSSTAAHQVSTASQQAASSDLQIYGNASGVNILTQADALSAIDSLDKAMNQVNVAQIQQGATQNRLSAIINSLTASNESTINARSHIMDTDFAAETASMARANILQQAGMAMLAQANTSNNGIMALMR